MAGLCGALLRNRAEAEDAAQQTFLSAHRALLNGSEPLEPAAWLATIARNECLGRIRAQMRIPLPAEPDEAPTLHGDPLAEAIRRADLVEIWAAIEALPRRQRDAILLREFGGLSYDELAAALAVTPPTVESLLFRARRRLRAELQALVASVGGAPLLEALARGFAGGGPVAAKVAALGLGAAAVTGGAVVAPQVLERAHRSLPPAQSPASLRPALPGPHPGPSRRAVARTTRVPVHVAVPAARVVEAVVVRAAGVRATEVRATGVRAVHEQGRREGDGEAARTPAPAAIETRQVETVDGGGSDHGGASTTDGGGGTTDGGGGATDGGSVPTDGGGGPDGGTGGGD